MCYYNFIIAFLPDFLALFVEIIIFVLKLMSCAWAIGHYKKDGCFEITDNKKTMAEMSMDPLKKLEEQLTCPICLEQYRNPKTLPCHHSFCLDCLEEMVKRKTHKQVISCPTCRKRYRVPSDGLGGYATAFFINNLVDVHAILREKLPTQPQATGRLIIINHAQL